MNYVDPVLRYLSGELSPEEQKSFREKLDSNEELKKEFDDISAAYELIRDQLLQRDEDNFREKLLEAMERESTSSLPRRSTRRWWFTFVAFAASLALLFVLWMKPDGKEQIVSRYYAPHKDPVILVFQQNTRGTQVEGILYFKQEHYQEAMLSLESLLNQNTGDKLIALYYLLSALELEKEEEIIDQMLTWEYTYSRLTDQALAWYASLALIKTDLPDEAVSLLEALVSTQGPYQADAENLLKLLLK